MAKGGFRIRYESKSGWRVETNTERAATANRRSRRRKTRSYGPKYENAKPADVRAVFDKAHEWLKRIEEVVVAGLADSAVENPSPPGDNSAKSPSPQSTGATDAAAPPPESVLMPPNPLEPVVPALEISFETIAQPGPGVLPPTRFGGLPDWLGEPQWPISRSLGTPMVFVAQIALHPDQLPWITEAKMAYLFESDDSEDPGGPETWDPFAGENAVIVQPGTAPSWVEVRTVATGPQVGLEVPVTLTPRLDPILLDNAQMAELRRTDPTTAERYIELIDYDKLGGTPNFFQGLELPDFDSLATTHVPGGCTTIMMIRNDSATRMNLGDAGRAVSFLSADQNQGAHLWFN